MNYKQMLHAADCYTNFTPNHTFSLQQEVTPVLYPSSVLHIKPGRRSRLLAHTLATPAPPTPHSPHALPKPSPHPPRSRAHVPETMPEPPLWPPRHPPQPPCHGASAQPSRSTAAALRHTNIQTSPPRPYAVAIFLIFAMLKNAGESQWMWGQSFIPSSTQTSL